MNKQFLLSASLLLLILSVTAGSAVMARPKDLRQNETPLAGKVLQRDDLPASEGYDATEVRDDRFPGPAHIANIPMRAEGFLQAYEAKAYLPLNEEPDGTFVMSLAYQYRDSTQAEAAFEQWIRFLKQTNLPADVSVETVEYIESLATANGMYGRALRFTYRSEGVRWQTHYLLGGRDDVLLFLMVDGLPSVAAREQFDALATIIIER